MYKINQSTLEFSAYMKFIYTYAQIFREIS